MFIIGDSHCIFYKSLNIKTHWVGWGGMPVTMHRLIQEGLPLYNIVERLPFGDICTTNIRDGDTVLFMYGWNDVQKNIYTYGYENYKNMIEIMVSDYIKLIISYKDGTRYRIKPIIGCVYPNPHSINDSIHGSNEERRTYSVYMNECLKMKCKENSIPFFDIYEILNEDGLIQNKYIDLDGTHLSRVNNELKELISCKLYTIIEEVV